MSNNKNNLPSFETLFGNIDLKKGDEGRSVYSPAAYLADLLQLLEDNFGNQNEIFTERRTDIYSGTVLNYNNTFTQVPYLDIVNNILKNKIRLEKRNEAFEALKEEKFPFNLPFNWENEKFKKHLSYSETRAVDLYKLFSIRDTKSKNEKDFLIAQEYLGLSAEEAHTIIHMENDKKSFFKNHFNLEQESEFRSPPNELREVASFLKITDISGENLLDLLFGNLSESAKNQTRNTERSQSNQLFINQGMPDFARLDSAEENILWEGEASEESPNDNWFLRIRRATQLIRLSKKTGISILDLQTIIKKCCSQFISNEAIITLAIIQQIHRNHEVPYDEICALISNMEIRGIGNDEIPMDLFNRIFNVNFTDLENEFIAISEFIPRIYADNNLMMLAHPTDIFDERNRDYRKRIQGALGISTKNLKLIFEKFKNKYKDDESLDSPFGVSAMMGIHELTLLFRISKLVEILDTTYLEFFDLLDVFESDPSIRKFAQFAILINDEFTELDCYKILNGNDPSLVTDDVQGQINRSLWLIQMLIAVNKWMQNNDFTADELKFILTGKLKTEKEMEVAKKQKLHFLNGLYEQFKTVFFREDYFVSDLFDERSSRVIHRTILEEEGDLISKKDQRIVNFKKDVAKEIADKALSQLNTFQRDDFLGLGIEEKMMDKIFGNLNIKRYLNTDGTLVEKNFPKDVERFKINNSSVNEQEQLFGVIHGLFQEENQGEEKEIKQRNDTFVDMRVFISDFEGLEIEETRKTELYDNLIFNNYIDDEGNVIEPTFFAKKTNQEKFEINAKIDPYSAQVYQIITKHLQMFERAKLKLSKDAFRHLPLKEIELDDLMENLRFNEYLDTDNFFNKKNIILQSDVKDFNLALMFYPHRYQILETIQATILKLKAKYYTFTKEHFQPVADEIVADLIYNNLKGNYFPNGMIEAGQKVFFTDKNNASQLEISPYFTNISTQVVFDTIANFIQTSQKYQLDKTDLEDFDMDAKDADELLSDLKRLSYLNSHGNILKDKVAYFLNINNAIHFEVEGFDDFNKDVFFTLHNIAKEVDGSISSIVDRVESLAKEQENITLSALQEYLEMPTELVNVVTTHVFRNPENVVEEVLPPILKTVDEDNKILNSPKDNQFNYSLKRMKQFASLASKLGLDEAATDVVFKDQELVEKFPEQLTLPVAINSFDLLFEWEVDAKTIQGLEKEGMIPVVFMFKNNQYWIYDLEDFSLLTKALPLQNISPEFAKWAKVDAAFKDENDNAWMISGQDYFYKKKGNDKWERKEKVWGKVESNFDDLEKIDASFSDQEGKIYLFSGDQYMRYSDNLQNPDIGYPKEIKGNWSDELAFKLPKKYYESIDAAFQTTNDTTYIFKNKKFISSENSSVEIDINQFWGNVKNNFSDHERIDACLAFDEGVMIFAGDQILVYSNSIENEGVFGDEGTLIPLEEALEGFPHEFIHGVDSAFKGFDENFYFFKNDKFSTILDDGDNENLAAQPILDQWGKIKNNILTSGKVDAAFTGLDGRTYLFSGDQYYRYSGSDYSQVDEGYPKTIAKDWGGLTKVDAAFVLNGKTYLFGKRLGEEFQTSFYVRYSTNDYTQVDEGYPKIPNDNWWNLPYKLVERGFSTPDAVFVGIDGTTHLFNNDQFISFDANHRWWSEPAFLTTKWDSIPFQSIAAAFTGKDGRTYIFDDRIEESDLDFSREFPTISLAARNAPQFKFIRYSDKKFNKIDDRFPKVIAHFWGKVANNIETLKKVDASISLVSTEMIVDDSGVENKIQTKHTYLFSGNQFFRYSEQEEGYHFVDEGYPKTIKVALKEEPRFKNLTVDLEKGIDAAFADLRNIYLIKGNEIHVVAEDLYRNYEDKLTHKISTAYFDEGKIFAEMELAETTEEATEEKSNRWGHLNSLEIDELDFTTMQPPLFRKKPEYMMNVAPDFKTNVDAVLKGTNGNTYLFKGENCFNGFLEKTYPSREEWGRVKNNIYFDNHVDAAFVGRDNKTYLFSGDQFVTYVEAEGLPNQLPSFIDKKPQSISEHWGGLSHVYIAYVLGEKTYLMEKPNEEGSFKFICCSNDDYSKISEEAVQVGDFSFWNIPENYVEGGFDQVNSAFVEEEHLFLVRGQNFIQYNDTEKSWTHERPLERVYRGIPFNETNFEFISAAFIGRDGLLYFFSDESFVIFDQSVEDSFSPIQSIKTHWGKVDNNFVEHGRVDAAFVFDKRITYLFSGDQFVKYSTSDYQFVDEGYPKLLLPNLRKEEAFKNLPPEFDKLMEKPTSTESRFDAIIANEGNIYFFENKNCHVLSQSLHRKYPINRLGKIRNTIAEGHRVDAAYLTDEGEVIIFAGDQFFKYSNNNFDYVDKGFPKTIKSDFANQSSEGSFGITEDFYYGIDAAVKIKAGSLHLFKDQKATSGNIKDIFGVPNNDFATEPNVPIDAAFVAPDGNFYLFKNGNYLRYAKVDNEYVDEGFPKSIKDNWGNLPVNFEARLASAFTFEGKTYFTQGEEYVRYSDKKFQAIDSIYPQNFIDRWNNWNDFLLNDLRTISQYKILNEENVNADVSLTDLFYDGNAYKKEPYQILAKIFDWEVEEVKWVKRNNAFLEKENQYEVDFNLELVNKMFSIFSIAKKVGTTPSELFSKIWEKKYSNNRPNLAAAANTLYASLGLNNSKKDWDVLSRQIHDELNLLQRDHLMPYVIANDDEVDNSRDLFNKLLIDVEMGSEGKTSIVKEAISAIQLYFHRYFVNLENPVIDKSRIEPTKEKLKLWWKWMRNYRVWEANRKVFLYPENYIRPELRDTKTPDFKTMEDDLLQGDLTTDLVEKAYQKYLDAYTEVSRLRIAGGYSYFFPQNRETKQLIFFGQTRSHPKKYFYRTAKFKEGSTRDAHWDPWLEVNIAIDSDRVYPVYAFGRMFVFWAKTETIASESEGAVMKVKTDGEDQTIERKSNDQTNIIKIYFSYYNLNKEWAPIQVLSSQGVNEATKREIVLSHKGKLSEVKLHIENSNKLKVSDSNVENFDFENIVINCSYKETKKVITGFTFDKEAEDFPFNFELVYAEDEVSHHKTFHLKPELVAHFTKHIPFPDSGIENFKKIFDAKEKVADDKIIPLNTFANSPDGPWFSFVHNGGSFLAKPAVDSLSDEHFLQDLELQNRFPLPFWNKVDAAFQGPDGKNYFFRNKDREGNVHGIFENQYLDIEDLENVDRQGMIPKGDLRWGVPFGEIEKVKAVFRDEDSGETYFLDQNGVYTYSENQLDFTDINDPKQFSNTRLSRRGFLPRSWNTFDAHFKNASGRSYFFNKGEVISQRNRTFSNEEFLTFGKVRNSITDPLSDTPVVGAFAIGDRTYLISDTAFENSQIFKYTGSEYRVLDPEFPKENTARILLSELGIRGRRIPRAITAEQKVTKAFNLIPNNFDLIRNSSHSNFGIYFETDAGGKFIISDGAISAVQNTLDFKTEFIDQIDINVSTISNINIELLSNISEDIQSGFIGDDNNIYLFFEKSYHRIPMSNSRVGGVFNPGVPNLTESITKKWGLELNEFTEDNAEVDAAFYDRIGRKTYLFRKDRYLVYSDANLVRGEYDLVDSSYPKVLSENTETDFLIPQVSKMDAVFKDADGVVYFFSETEFFTSVKNGRTWNLSSPAQIQLKFGVVRNNIMENGVDAAFTVGNKIFLTSGDEYVRYTSLGSVIPQKVDRGYPKKMKNIDKNRIIDAVFKLEDESGQEIVYIFSKNKLEDGTFSDGDFAKITDGDDLENLQNGNFKSIKGNWGNMIPELKKGFSAALNTPSQLYLFKFGAFVHYDLETTDNTDPVLPFEIGEVDYDIIRLTTNTSFKLTQALFEGGVDGLLQTRTQEIDETPAFALDTDTDDNGVLVNPADPNLVVLKANRIKHYPNSSYLDFNSANGIYYWEIFFHAPFLLAQAFNTSQKFEESKKWYEYIYDPTESTNYWKFLPFLSVDIEALIISGEQSLRDLFHTPADDVLEKLEEYVPFFSGKRNLPPGERLNTIPIDNAKAFLQLEKVKEENKSDTNPTRVQGINQLISIHDQVILLPQKFENGESVNVNKIISDGKGFLNTIFPERNNNSVKSVMDELPDLIPLFSGKIDLAQGKELKAIDVSAANEFLHKKFKKFTKPESADKERAEIIIDLKELMGIVDQLPQQFDLMQTSDSQRDAFLEDPFDPHAIAYLRRIAYRRSIVMSYVDNLLDWGDMLFRQYTIESINEARMLYILAYDLLGKKPESFGTRTATDHRTFEQLNVGGIDLDFLLEMEDSEDEFEPTSVSTILSEQGPVQPVQVHDSIISSYFHIPENSLFLKYWDRVEDRLYKIRQSLNILGIKQPLPLFQPPIDPMAIVQAVGSGASLGQALASFNVAIPHYRFSFMLNKSRELVSRLNEFGSELLAALEKKDAEVLSLMYSENEGIMLNNTMSIKEAQLEESEFNIESLKWSKQNATDRVMKYDMFITAGKMIEEQRQIGLMQDASNLMVAAGVIKLAAGFGQLLPDNKLGLFIMGAEWGGTNLGGFIEKIAESLETLGDGISMKGEAIGIEAQFLRMKEEWELQKLLAESDVKQIEAQLQGAEILKAIAKMEINNLEKEIAQNESVQIFMKGKFTNQQLYQWMVSQLSSMYYQTYKLAFDMAKSTEKAFQFERAFKESDANFIHPSHWDNQRKGLLAGNRLGLDLDKMEKAYLETDKRLFEISKKVSLLDLDPIAFLELKSTGACEFTLNEAFFDYDFPGHYCRQIKTIFLSFDAAEGDTVLATLTQLNHKVVLEPDPKAVKFLLKPKDKMPLSIRSNWKNSQQIILSHVDEFEKSHGMFELRYEDEKYFPFEGTGAVSTWRLELNGKQGSYKLNEILDVSLNVKYTAIQGGDKFTNTVRGMLKPYLTTRYFDLVYDFGAIWDEFLGSDSNEFTLPITRDLFPNISSSKVLGIYAKYEMLGEEQVTMILNDDDELTLKDRKFIPTDGLSISSRGTALKFKVKGDKLNILNVELVFSYKAKV